MLRAFLPDHEAALGPRGVDVAVVGGGAHQPHDDGHRQQRQSRGKARRLRHAATAAARPVPPKATAVPVRSHLVGAPESAVAGSQGG